MSRKERRKKFELLVAEIKTLPDLTGQDDVEKIEEQFKQYWGVIKSVLEWAVMLPATRKKLDNALKDVIVLGDQAADNRGDKEANRKFVEAANKYWPKVKFALNAVMAIWENDDYDPYILKAMLIGDIITQNDED